MTTPFSLFSLVLASAVCVSHTVRDDCVTCYQYQLSFDICYVLSPSKNPKYFVYTKKKQLIFTLQILEPINVWLFLVDKMTSMRKLRVCINSVPFFFFLFRKRSLCNCRNLLQSLFSKQIVLITEGLLGHDNKRAPTDPSCRSTLKLTVAPLPIFNYL